MEKIKKRYFMDTTNDIIRGMELSKKQMIEEGLWNENTTLEDWSAFAASNIRIHEQPERLNPEDHIVEDNKMVCDSLNSMET